MMFIIHVDFFSRLAITIADPELCLCGEELHHHIPPPHGHGHQHDGQEDGQGVGRPSGVLGIIMLDLR